MFFAQIINPDPDPKFTEYAVLRSRVMILEQTIDSLGALHELALALGRLPEYSRVLRLYLDFQKKAIDKKEIFDTQNAEMVSFWQEKIVRKTLKNLEETVISDLSKKELVSERFRHILRIKESDFQGFLEHYEEIAAPVNHD